VSSLVIAIDGGAASGKSTVARAVAARYELEYIDSGSFYRFLTYRLLELRVPMEESTVLAVLPVIHFEFRHGKHHRRGHILTRELRSPLVESQVSFVAAIPAVREKVNAALRQLVEGKRTAVEGRDIGTVVFPLSPLKFFLVADLKVRNRRRVHQRRNLGLRAGEEEVQENIRLRDRIDSTRSIAPLAPASDALILDTSRLSLDETLSQVFSLVEERLDSGQLALCPLQ
jgi:cytidylate kinase